MSYFRVTNKKGESAEFTDAVAATHFYCIGRFCDQCPMYGYGDQEKRCIIATPPDNWKKLANERDPDGFQIKPEYIRAKTRQEPEQRAGGHDTNLIKLSSEVHRLIGRIEGMTYRCTASEAQNSLQDDIGKLTKIIGELVEYVKEETT